MASSIVGQWLPPCTACILSPDALLARCPFGSNLPGVHLQFLKCSDSDLEVQIHSVEQPVKSHSVCLRNVTHRRTSAFDDHLYHCFIVLTNCTTERFVEKVLRSERANFVRVLGCFSHCERNASGLFVPMDDGDDECKTSISKTASQERGRLLHAYDPVQLCETAVCFFHIQLLATKVRLPKMHQIPPYVDLKSLTSPAKSES